jgi:hypothetical protein
MYNSGMEQIPNNAALTNDPTSNLSPPTPPPQVVSATPVPDSPLAPGTPPLHLLELSPMQTKALVALAAGRSLADAAGDAGVDPSTIYRWKKNDPHFIVAMNAWRIEAMVGARDRLLALTDEATRAAYRLLRKDNPSVTIAIVKTIGSLAGVKPGTTDAAEAADALRRREEKRQEARKRRLRKEAEDIRLYAHSAHYKRQKNRKQMEETRAAAAQEPESVMRELRRADELCFEADGLPTTDDALPKP